MRALLPAAALAGLLAVAAPAGAADCPNAGAVEVPGAERQELACLDDLTTAGTQTNGPHRPQRLGGRCTPAARATRPACPGLQVDGYFPDTSTTNTHARLEPRRAVRDPAARTTGTASSSITGAPGVRKQYANDFVISDWVLARGYAFASTDKGNTGTQLLPRRRGARRRDRRVAPARDRADARGQGGRRAAATAAPPARTYMTGISNGGYLTRWQLENRPDLYDGGVDWEGTLLRARRAEPVHLPAGRAASTTPRYRARATRRRTSAMLAAGFAPGLGVPVGRPLRRLLGPHAAHLPRGVRPRATTARSRPASRSASPARRTATPTTTTPSRPAAGAATRSRKVVADRAHRQADAHAARHARRAAADPRPTPTSTRAWSRGRARGDLHRYYVVEERQPRRRPLRRASRTGCGRSCRATARRSSRSSAGSSAARRRRRTRPSREPRGGDVVNECALPAARRRAPSGARRRAPGGPARRPPARPRPRAALRLAAARPPPRRTASARAAGSCCPAGVTRRRRVRRRSSRPGQARPADDLGAAHAAAARLHVPLERHLPLARRGSAAGGCGSSRASTATPRSPPGAARTVRVRAAVRRRPARG